MTSDTPLTVVRVFARKPGGRWKLLGVFADRSVGFAAADAWPIIYLNDQPTADPPPGFGPITCPPPAADEMQATAGGVDPDD
jgi:hypothetical protein